MHLILSPVSINGFYIRRTYISRYVSLGLRLCMHIYIHHPVNFLWLTHNRGQRYQTGTNEKDCHRKLRK